MKYEHPLSAEAALRDVPPGQVCLVRPADAPDAPPRPERLRIQTAGRGHVEAYSVFPGAEAAFNVFLASDVTFHHAVSPAGIDVFYCRSGRVGWNIQGDTAVYLGAGDMAVLGDACSAHTAMTLPLGCAEGLFLSLDLETLADRCPGPLQLANLEFSQMQRLFCGECAFALPACTELAEIVSPLYRADPSLRLPYLQLKVQELLLYLSRISLRQKGLPRYFSRQTALIREIHALLTQNLDRRFTIEDLSRRYGINTSTLKAVFKTVYGLPIATYMREYRIRQAMLLLRETDHSIAQIAEQLGYESQGKFTNAFKDVAQLLPSEYRKQTRK